MESMYFAVTDEFGHRLMEPMYLNFTDIYWIKQTFVCDVQWGQLVLY